MSSVEIFGFGKNGKVITKGEVRNSWRGAFSVWDYLSIKYFKKKVSLLDLNRGMDNVCDLFGDERLCYNEKIVLGSTFDNVLIKKENFDKLFDAYNDFDGETNLKEQIKIIERMIKDKNINAIGYNQTSVNCDRWENYKYNEKKDKYYSYNYKKQKDHWWLFDEIKKIRKELVL